MKVLLALVTLCFASLAFAQPQPRPQQPPPAKEIVFGNGDEIIGEGDGPDVQLFQEPAKVSHTTLIQVRENFRAQVLRSVQDLP